MSHHILQTSKPFNQQMNLCIQWVGPISDIDAEFDLINKDGGGNEILFTEFIDWALEKDLDIEDDDDNF